MPQKNTEQYSQLKKILTQMFQLDQAELDFGIYRIMNQKRQEINAFLDDELLTQIHEVLKESGNPAIDELKQELINLENILQSAGINPDENDKVKSLRQQVAQGGSTEVMELEVYSRLTQFFKRYYKEGDFISQRRYKEGVYAIPYEGEEVKLHWANHDQYYIKTGENFKNYSFKADGKSIHFVLKEADTERDNNKAQAGKERRFRLYQSDENSTFEETENGELTIYFTYEPVEKKENQKKLNEQTLKFLKENLPGNWSQVLLQKKPTQKNKNRTLLEYRLNDYTAKNSFDYFIHKDLGKFLRQELDFYIKNEILNLDDIDLDSEQSFQKQLTLIKALKKVARKIIAFLAQLEDFQKKLFLKKKMVLQSDYCITLDRIDETFYEDIANNERQLKEWQELFVTDEIEGFKENIKLRAVETLKENPYLLVDTQFFPTEWKYKLLATLDNIDKQNDGLLINSENFQALNLMQERYCEQVKCVYIDPPYNTEKDRQEGKFIYKDNYDNSSWASLIFDRLSISRSLLKKSGVFFSSIDANEIATYKFILDMIIDQDNFEGLITWRRRHNQPNDKTKMIGLVSEYLLSYSKNKYFYKKDGVGKVELTGKFNNPDGDERGDWATKAWKVGSDQSGSLYRIITPTGEVYDEEWMGDENTFKKLLDDNRIVFPKNGKGSPRKKYFKSEREEEGQCAINWWSHKQFGHNQGANDNMTKIFGNKNVFSNPKPIELIKNIISLSNTRQIDCVLDYFAGSGTTAHATINLNREDNGDRKYILVEMGEYFNSVTKPRVQKVIYSEDWKNGKPVSRKGSSHCFKYMRLESYEDTLNNLYLKKSDVEDAMREEYVLHYSLDVESRDSLLMLEAFKKPFGYKIKSTANNELIETEVDLVESFNYLIGLQVKTLEIIRGYVVVTGETLDEKKVLVIWRDVDKHSNADLNEFFSKMKFIPLDGEFDQIYVNGDNNIENLKTEEARWKVRMIEHEFHKRMWALES